MTTQQIDEKVNDQEKKAYQSPKLIEWGVMKDLTKGDEGSNFDDGPLGHNL
jgi:hypothetical protein